MTHISNAITYWDLHVLRTTLHRAISLILQSCAADASPSLPRLHVLEVPLITRQVFLQQGICIFVEIGPYGVHSQWHHQHVWIVHGRLPDERVAFTVQPLDDPHVST